MNEKMPFKFKRLHTFILYDKNYSIVFEFKIIVLK